ncbi:MAG TPA: hypothetical protein VE994_08295 [Terriglobales bacterium]|nr:hypothetical protein [Terriglobales bacterium]
MSGVSRCHYINSDGRHCGSPALREDDYCYFHQNWRENELRRLRGLPPCVAIPDMHDENSVEGAFTELVRLMLTDQIDDTRAGQLLHALQTSAADLEQLWYAD